MCQFMYSGSMVERSFELTGVDTDFFKAYPYRAASLSATYNRGCSMKNILHKAQWSSDKNLENLTLENL